MTDYEDKDYYYNSSERKLYINGNCNIDSLLYEIAIEGKSDIDKDDYRILCIEGKVSVTQEALQEKDNTIALLKADNERLIALLKNMGLMINSHKRQNLVMTTLKSRKPEKRN